MQVRLSPRFAPWAFLVLALFWTRDGWSRAGATLVALVTTDPSAELTHRVEEQLEALGYDVLVLNPVATGSVGPASLEQAARNVGAIAAVRIVPMAQSVQVWTADPVTGQAVFREIAPAAGQKPSDASVALGAVELLRASLLELHPPPDAIHEKKEPPPTCPPPPPAEAPKEPTVGVTAGAGLSFVVAGAPAVALEAGAWGRLAGRIGLRALAIASVAPGKVVSSTGTEDIAVDARIFGAELTYDLAEASRPFVTVVGLGLAGAEVSAHGLATQAAGFNLDQSQWVALPFAHIGQSYAPLRGLRLRADALGGVSVPQLNVNVCTLQGNSSACTLQAVHTVAQWGQPFVNVSLGLEVLLAP